jgi:hypothetical protein
VAEQRTSTPPLSEEHADELRRIAAQARADGLGPHSVVDEVAGGLDGAEYREALAIAIVWGFPTSAGAP